jgi:uncharacterized membrane protein
MSSRIAWQADSNKLAERDKGVSTTSQLAAVGRDAVRAEMQIIKPRSHIGMPRSFGERAADSIANGMGSWRFIIVQSVFVVGWIALNLLAVIGHWDPYPFILLNLLFSTQAAYAAPVIMMSQNRQAQKDHLRDDHEAEEVEMLYKINQQQLEILQILHHQLCRADAPSPAADAAASP